MASGPSVGSLKWETRIQLVTLMSLVLKFWDRWPIFQLLEETFPWKSWHRGPLWPRQSSAFSFLHLLLSPGLRFCHWTPGALLVICFWLTCGTRQAPWGILLGKLGLREMSFKVFSIFKFCSEVSNWKTSSPWRWNEKHGIKGPVEMPQPSFRRDS